MASALYPHRLLPTKQEVRVLVVAAGLFDDNIEGSLLTVSLLDQPDYLALSYVWGDQTDTVCIFVNGIPFQATRNLALALRYIRKPDVAVTLWADAVCINQADVDERNDQVAIMGILYSQATRVFIWLGEPDPSTEELVDLVQHGDLSPPLDAMADDQTKAHEEYALPFTRAFVLIEILALRPWWRRVWTVQECVLAKQNPMFVVGDKRFGWANFYHIWFKAARRNLESGLHSRLVDEHPQIVKLRELRDNLNGGVVSERERLQMSQVINSLHNTRVRLRSRTSISLAASIAPCIERQGSVLHDYVYGFLGLMNSQEKANIRIDYRRPHLELFREVSQLMFGDQSEEGRKVIDLMSFASDDEDQPSWILDFSNQKNVMSHTGFGLATDVPFSAFEEVRFSKDNEVMMLRGTFVDVIGQIHGMKDDPDYWVAQAMDFTQMIHCEQSRTSPAATHTCLPKDVIDASRTSHILEILLGKKPLGQYRKDSDSGSNKSQYESIWNIMTTCHSAGEKLAFSDRHESKRPLSDLKEHPFWPILLQITSRMYLVCRNRSLILTQNGLSGLCVPNAQPGDHIVCLQGFHMPYVLRPRDDHYRIVGGVRLSGLMDWEVLSACLRDGSMGEATFRIR